jgi:hypothetical protein
MSLGEPIPGAVSPESSLPKPEAIQRVEEILQLQAQVSGKYDSSLNSKLFAAKRQLTHDVSGILDRASSLSPQDKLQLAMSVIPLVSWDYDRSMSHDFGRNIEAVQAKQAALDRHGALDSFLRNIPDEQLDDPAITKLLDIADANPNEHLDEVRNRVVQTLANSPSDRGRKYLDRLQQQEWPSVINNWSFEEARPQLAILIAKLDQDKDVVERSKAYRNIIAATEGRPQKYQEEIIRQVLTQQRIDSYSKEFFVIMKEWTHDEAKPFLQDIIALPIDPKIGHIYAEKNYRSLAKAMSNWSSKDIDDFLREEQNTRWIHYVANYESQKAGYSQERYQAIYDEHFHSFRMEIVSNRSIPLDDDMAQWVVEAGVPEDVILKHRELFTPQMAIIMMQQPLRYRSRNSSGGGEYSVAINMISEMPLIKQYDFMEAIFVGCERYYTQHLFDILEGWDNDHLDKLIDGLIERSGFNKDGQVGPQSLVIESVFQVLDLKSQVDNPVHVRQIVKYALDYRSTSVILSARLLMKKLADTSEVNLAIAAGAQDAVINILNSTTDFNMSSLPMVQLAKIAENYDLSSINDYKDKIPTFLKSIAENFGFDSLDEVLKLLSEHNKFAKFLSKNPDQPVLINTEDMKKIPILHISLLEAEELRRAGMNLLELETEEDLERMIDTLITVDRDWRNYDDIIQPFKAGAEIFGYGRMLSYMDRRHIDGDHQPTMALALTRHDALHAFEDIIGLFRASHLTPDQFWGNVLNQVSLDDMNYSEGSANLHLNAIAQTVNTNIPEVLSRVNHYQGLTKLQILSKNFETPEQVFGSWNRLKRYSSLVKVLEQAEILDELKELKARGKNELYSYVETLAFHPNSKVDMSSVMQFWRDPESFFRAASTHTSREVHDRKKPSNYIDMVNLDLTAEELRDALVEGKMDNLQTFSPLEITYDIPLADSQYKDVKDVVQAALGSRKHGIAGTARSTSRLFSELTKILKPYGLSVQSYLENSKLPESLDNKLIENIVYHPEFGTKRPEIKHQRYVAKINFKSDPEGVLAGNDTANCMPFGDGKNTVYTFNPNTAHFILQIVRDDGSARTIAQSVLTKDIDIGLSVPELLSKLAQNGEHLEEALPQTITQSAPAYIACDNIEVAPNYAKAHELIIEKIYRDFFREYAERFGSLQNLVTGKVIIGQENADALKYLPDIPNTFVPQAPVSYSDKTGDNVYVLDVSQAINVSFFGNKVVKVLSSEPKRSELTLNNPGLQYLTFQDTLRAAYLEGKAYSDNQSLMQFLHNLENCLIAKDINNAAKDRPNLSLKYSDDSGRMRGYIIAYEGVLNDEDLKSGVLAEDYYGEKALYIADLASDKEDKQAGAILIYGFIDLYKQLYLDNDNLLPIYAQARDNSSYRIIQVLLKRMSVGTGINFELIELPTYEKGEDVMHPIIIKPRRAQ